MADALRRRSKGATCGGVQGLKFLIAFDLDGTLIDSRQDLAESTNEMLESYGAPPLPIDEVAGFVGEGACAGAAELAASGRSDEPDALDRFLAIYDRRLLIHTRPPTASAKSSKPPHRGPRWPCSRTSPKRQAAGCSTRSTCPHTSGG
jgi:phosphoglycolate phosphatase